MNTAATNPHIGDRVKISPSFLRDKWPGGIIVDGSGKPWADYRGVVEHIITFDGDPNAQSTIAAVSWDGRARLGGRIAARHLIPAEGEAR